MSNEKFVENNFNLPQHKEEITVATDVIEKIKLKLKCKQQAKTLDDKTFVVMYEETVRMLDYVGNLSKPAFEIGDELEGLYYKKYPHSPKLAKKLWLDHYETIHKKYNILKNRCFKILDKLDELYWKVNKKQPPNWNI